MLLALGLLKMRYGLGLASLVSFWLHACYLNLGVLASWGCVRLELEGKAEGS